MSAAADELKRRLVNVIDALAPFWKELALRIHAHPELGFQEEQACAWLSQALEEAGFAVTRGAAGLPTAFVAVKETSADAPVVAFLAEYDAMPETGHSCGHNLSGAASCLAGQALVAAAGQQGVRVRVLGTPGEEKELGGKLKMLDAGLLADVDFAMMAHAGFMNLPSRDMLCSRSVTVEFRGEPPKPETREAASSALDALLLTFNGMALLRRGLPHRATLDGIITDGGKVTLGRPDHSYVQARFMMRATGLACLESLERRLVACAEGAAAATGTTLSWSTRAGRYLPMKRNGALEAAYAANLRWLGEEVGCFPPDASIGFTDFGNVSQVTPGIHAYFKASPPGVPHHTPEYADIARSQAGLAGMVVAAKAMALTGLDLTLDSLLRQQVQDDFHQASQPPPYKPPAPPGDAVAVSA